MFSTVLSNCHLRAQARRSLPVFNRTSNSSAVSVMFKHSALRVMGAWLILAALQPAAWGAGFSAAASMGTPRSDHAQTLLSSGKVLVVGGYGGPGFYTLA